MPGEKESAGIVRPAAFEALAAGYDAGFSHTPLARLLRPRVWRELGSSFPPGSRVLELACGTGEDAVWLGQRGVTVTATDAAPAMVAQTAAKAAHAGIAPFVITRRLALQELHKLEPATPFDGVFSNFGGLNTVGDLAGIAAALAPLVRPGGQAVFVLMGPFCPWESGWYLLHGQPGLAFRRWQRQARARIGGSTIPVWYPSPGHLARAFAPYFRARRMLSLGFWLPPSYLGHLVERWPRFFAWLNRLEEATAGLSRGLGDHYIALFTRGDAPPRP